MAQSYSVSAFRKRLYRWGYTDISIERVGDFTPCKFTSQNTWYLVQAVEPLAGKKIEFICAESDMHNLLNRKRRKKL